MTDGNGSKLGLLREFAILLATATVLLGSSAIVGAQGCPGDCDFDGRVTVGELIVGVNISLGTEDLEECLAFDSDEDKRVEIHELVAAVSAAMQLGRCPPALYAVTSYLDPFSLQQINDLWIIDPNSGRQAAKIGRVIEPFLPGIRFTPEIEWSRDGETLYAVVSTGVFASSDGWTALVTVDSSHGGSIDSMILTGEILEDGERSVSALEFDGDGRLLGIVNTPLTSSLATIDLETGVVEILGETEIDWGVKGLAFDEEAVRLFAIAAGTPAVLLVLDPANGSVTEAVETDLPGEADALEFNVASRELLTVSKVDGRATLYAIDPSTGEALELGLAPSGVTGLSFRIFRD